MKKIFTIALLALSAFSVKAQKRASLINDTARYNGISYTTGDTLRLEYGSQPDKSFAFISFASSSTGSTDLDKSRAKSKAVIEKIYVQRKTVYINAKLIDKEITAGSNSKLLIDLEAAVDNKEIK